MFKTNYTLATLAATCSLLLLTGCNSGSGSGNSAAAGSMTLGITDAPVDGAESVIIEFTGVEIQPESGELISITYDAPRSIDLLALQGGLRDLLLDGESLPAGQYSWIRLMINAEADNIFDSYIVIGGNQYELDIPSGAQTGLKLNRSFEVPEEMSVDLTIDFDLRKSIHMPSSGTDYKLRPTLRSVATPDSGIISGTIDPTLIPTERCAEDAVYAIYLFQGPSAVIDDIDDLAVDGDVAPDPIITVNVDLDVSSGNYSFTIPYLEPNSYTVTATCRAQLDEPNQNDSELMSFYGTTDVVVTAGEAGTINFTESSVAPL